MSKSDKDAATNQVLEYYKKYSQNPHLQKYFSGSDTISCAVLGEETSTAPKAIPKVIISESPICIPDLTNTKVISVEDSNVLVEHKISQSCDSKAVKDRDGIPTSLMKRSNSLPTKLSQTEIDVDLSQVSSTENIKILVFQSSSSSDDSDRKPEVQATSSTSSSAKHKTVSTSTSIEEDNKIVSFGLTLSQLKENIGLPIAFSTPTLAVNEGVFVDQGYDVTPRTCTAQKNIRCLVLKSVEEEQGPEQIETRKMDKIESSSSSNKSETQEVGNNTGNENSDDQIDTPFSKIRDSIYVTKNLQLQKMSLNSRKRGKHLVETGSETVEKLPEKKTVELSVSHPLNINCLCDNKTEIAVQTETNLPDSQASMVAESSCYSFEYISSNIESSKKAENQNGDVGESTNSTIDRSSKSKSSEENGNEDIDKLVNILQILLTSKKDKIGKKKENIKKILQTMLSSSELSSTSPSQNKKSERVSSESEQERKPHSKDDFLSQNCPGASSRSLTKQSEFLKEKSNSSDDYILKFAENERMYQIAWIDNEISHLSKLKKFLESNKDHSSTQMKNTKKHSTKYKILGRDETTNQEMQREYVIESDLAVSDNAKINYVIDGKKFTVAQSNDSGESYKSSVIADIEVESKLSGTNIRISSLCGQCKQGKCICKSDFPKNTESALFSSADVKEPTETTNEAFESSEDIHAGDLNSLEKVFQNCDCKTKHSDHTCPFVEKLTQHFSRYNYQKTTANASVQAFDTPPEKLTCTKEVQAKVETLDKQLQHIKTLIKKQKNARTKDQQKHTQEGTTSSHILQKHISINDIQGTSYRPRSIGDSLDKMIQTDESLKRCIRGECKMVQTENGDGHNIRMKEDMPRPIVPELRSNNIDQIVKTEKVINGQQYKGRIKIKEDIPGSVSELSDNKMNQLDIGRDKINAELEKDIAKEEKISRSERDEKSKSAEGTFATYSQPGSSSVSIPTSILDNVQSTNQTCACCGRTFPQEQIHDNAKNNLIMCCCKKYTLAYCNNPLLRCYCHGQTCKSNNYYCICDKNQSHKYKTYCKRCRKKLMDTVKKQRQGLAYTLILEENSNKEEEAEEKVQKYEEVKMQIPKKESSKRFKDRRNSYERNKFDSLQKQESVQDKMQENKQYTLKEYLIENRPEFIYSAEWRRQMMLNSRISREYNKDALKINFLDKKGPPINGKRKLYSQEEMKQINRRNYEKLPEVRQKQVKKYEKRLRDADRAICDRFARKIQGCVLKGKADFPIDKNIINL